VTDANASANSLAEMQRAGQSLRAAEVLAREGLFADAVSSAYYAAFHAARALLFTVGLEPRSHRGAQHLFNVHFIQTGRIAASSLSALSRAEYDRIGADYGTARQFTAQDASESLARAREFVAVARACLDPPGS
jgi:uncharacterized protein (UPF0332 family)